MLVLKYLLMILGAGLFGSAGALVVYDIYLSEQLRRLLGRGATGESAGEASPLTRHPFGPIRWGLAMSSSEQTGQSAEIHSPDEWANVVVTLTIPAAWSMAVACTVAISCWPKVLRTMSSPLESGA